MPRVGLDRGRVIAEAAALADEEGLAALTLAALAARLGVRSPSLYAHIEGLEDVRRGVAALASRELADALQASAAGLAGGDALRAIAATYRAFAKRRPGSYLALQRASYTEGPSAQQIVDVILAVLRGYGIELEAGIHAVRAIRSALHGFVLLETGGGFGLPTDVDDSFAALVDLLDRGLRDGERGNGGRRGGAGGD